MKIKRSSLVIWKKRMTVFLISLTVFFSLYVYFKTSLFTITAYELVGVPDMYKDEVTDSLRLIAAQKRYKVIPGDKILSYHNKNSKQAVINILPNTQTVMLVPIGLHTLRVSVTHYEPLFKIDDTHGITKEAVVYTEFKDMSTLPKIVFASSTRKEMVKDGVVSSVIVGVDETKLVNLSVLINKINAVIFVVSKIDIDEFGDISLYDESGLGRIIFSGATDSDKVWSNILSAIDTDPLKSKLLNNKDKLEYLDARFGNKVFYKFTNATKTAIIQSHEATTTATTTLPQ